MVPPWSAHLARDMRGQLIPDFAPLNPGYTTPSAQHYDLGADLDASVEIDHVVIRHAETSRRRRGADRLRLVRAVDAVERGAEIHGARAERIFVSAFHVARQIGPADQHLGRRRPVGPLALRRDRGDARPGEAEPAHADAVADRLPAAQQVIEPTLARADDDGAGNVVARKAH